MGHKSITLKSDRALELARYLPETVPNNQQLKDALAQIENDCRPLISSCTALMLLIADQRQYGPKMLEVLIKKGLLNPKSLNISVSGVSSELLMRSNFQHREIAISCSGLSAELLAAVKPYLLDEAWQRYQASLSMAVARPAATIPPRATQQSEVKPTAPSSNPIRQPFTLQRLLYWVFRHRSQ